MTVPSPVTSKAFVAIAIGTRWPCRCRRPDDQINRSTNQVASLLLTGWGHSSDEAPATRSPLTAFRQARLRRHRDTVVIWRQDGLLDKSADFICKSLLVRLTCHLGFLHRSSIIFMTRISRSQSYQLINYLLKVAYVWLNKVSLCCSNSAFWAKISHCKCTAAVIMLCARFFNATLLHRGVILWHICESSCPNW